MSLLEIFDEADKDGDKTLKRSESENILKDEDLLHKMMSASSGMTKNDLVKLFDYLSEDVEGKREPVVRRDNFIDGLQRERRAVSERSILRLEKRIHEMETSLSKIAERVCTT